MMKPSALKWWSVDATGDGEMAPWPGAELFWRQILGAVMGGGREDQTQRRDFEGGK